MADENERLDRILERVTKSREQFQEQAAKSQREFAAHRQSHEEALERHDAEMKVIREAIAADAESIRHWCAWKPEKQPSEVSGTSRAVLLTGPR